MSIQVDRRRAHDLAPRLDEALEIVCNEFDGLDPHRQYRNAFARLLKPDPLGRVTMMGTDQRDLFTPVLRAVISGVVPEGGHIFDFGAGDGQTFALVADGVPGGTRVSIEEPNEHYLADYVAFLGRQPHLAVGTVLAAGLDDFHEVAERTRVTLPPEGSVDLVLAMHMLYFASDLESCLVRLARFVRPGGELFSVLADEKTAYGGRILQAFIHAGGDTGANDRHLSAIEERRALLGPASEGGGGAAVLLRTAGLDVEVEAVRQESRLYGHSLADLLALANIGALVDTSGTLKFQVAAETLRDRPEEVDLRIETDGPRTGMWSVAQPQWVTRVRRLHL